MVDMLFDFVVDLFTTGAGTISLVLGGLTISVIVRLRQKVRPKTLLKRAFNWLKGIF